MADYPALPLWTDAYLADTRHLTTAEHGAYLLLLMEAWRRPSCTLPDDDLLMARLAGMSEADWAASKPIIMAFWTFDGRRKEWRQKRLIKERDFLRQLSARRANAAASRWNGKKKDDAIAMQMPCKPHAPTPTPTPTPISKKEGRKEGGKTRVNAPPSQCLSDDAMQAWNAMADRAGLARCQLLSKPRRAAILARIEQAGGIDGWCAAVAKVEASQFLRGANDRKWRASIDFLSRESSFIKIMEGVYDTRSSGGDAGRRTLGEIADDWQSEMDGDLQPDSFRH